MYQAIIVDDEKMIRMGIKNGLQWANLGVSEVYTAASVREALTIIADKQPHIMLTDISMPEVTGLELIRRIRKTNRDMRIIVLTGYERFDYAQQCLKMQVQDFLLKPIDEKDLLYNIKKQITALEETRSDKEQEQKLRRADGARQQVILEEFMRDIIYRRNICNEIEQYPEELRSDSKRPMEVVVLLPSFIGEGRQRDVNYQILTIKNICIGMVDARRQGITFIDDEQRVVIAFFSDYTEKSITERMEELCGILVDEGGLKPRVVFGSQVSNINFLSVSYQDAILLLTQEREDFAEFVKPKAALNREKIIQEIYLEFKRVILLNLADEDYVLHVYDAFKKATFSYHFSDEQVKLKCFEMISDIYFSYILESKGKVDHSLIDVTKSLVSAKREEVLEITESFIQNITSKGKGDSHEVVEKARRYIDENIDENLSVADIADRFYLAPNYFSRLFKQVMNEGCNEYIVRKRIEKSRVLLETTTIKAGKIALMVGYHDTNYFSVAFKKHMGMSPTKYRETVQKNRYEGEE